MTLIDGHTHIAVGDGRVMRMVILCLVFVQPEVEIWEPLGRVGQKTQ